MTRAKKSKAMLEVREWKAACDAEVAHLPPREAVRKLLEDSARTAERLGFHVPKREAQPVAVIAETPAKYRAGRRSTTAKKS